MNYRPIYSLFFSLVADLICGLYANRTIQIKHTIKILQTESSYDISFL